MHSSWHTLSFYLMPADTTVSPVKNIQIYVVEKCSLMGIGVMWGHILPSKPLSTWMWKHVIILDKGTLHSLCPLLQSSCAEVLSGLLSPDTLQRDHRKVENKQQLLIISYNQVTVGHGSGTKKSPMMGTHRSNNSICLNENPYTQHHSLVPSSCT